jgi:hypothetical protein
MAPTKNIPILVLQPDWLPFTLKKIQAVPVFITYIPTIWVQ